MRKLLSFLFLYISFLSFGQNVNISGSAIFFANEKIRVFEHSNLLVNKLQLINETEISETGDYELTFKIEEPKELVLQLEMRELRFFIHPNSKLEINFHPIKNADNQLIPLRTGIRYLEAPKNTAFYFDYHKVQTDFANYQLQITIKESRAVFYQKFFDSTLIEFNTLLKHDSLFNLNFTYFRANALLQTEISKSQLFKRYISNQPIQYFNQNYLDFFRTQTRIRIHKQLSKKPKDLAAAISEYKVYESVMNILISDSLLANKEIRSLALLLYCLDPQSTALLDQETKNAILNQISNFCPYPIQKHAATLYQKEHSVFDIGAEAPEIELLDSRGDFIKLSSFRGKITYLGFINSKSYSCVRDLSVIPSLKKKYRKVNYVFVVCDRDSLQMENFPPESANLTYLFIDKDYTALEKYQIWNFPVYYLLDKHGYFIQSPGKNPMNIMDDLKIIFAPKSKNKNYEIIKG